MLFWFAVLVGVIFAVFAIKSGFYAMWAVLFNILISVFLSVMLCPTIIGLVPDIGDSRYHYAGCVAGIAVVAFAILQTITVNFLIATKAEKIDEEKIAFPQIFNTVGAGLVGFLAGYIVCGFVLFVVLIMPVSKEPIVKSICEQSGFAAQSVQKVCDFVGEVSLQSYEQAGPKAVVDWLTTPEEKLSPSRTKQSK